MKIFKFHAINVNLLQSLIKKTHWYSKLSLLNDPFECFFIDETNQETYQNFVSKLCVCCFAKNMDDILMWSHYANNHSGICLEFEIIDEQIIKGQLIEIEYNNELLKLNNIERTKSGHLLLNIDSNGKFLTTKFENWSYEKEIRTYAVSDDRNSKGREGAYLGNIIAIYFGKNTSNDDIALVKHNSNHIENLKYYQVDLNTKTMKMDSLKQI